MRPLGGVLNLDVINI